MINYVNKQDTNRAVVAIESLQTLNSNNGSCANKANCAQYGLDCAWFYVPTNTV